MIPNEGFFLISRLTGRQAKFMSKNETHFCFDSPSYYQGYLWIKKCLIVKTWRWFNITIHTFVTQGLAISSYGSQWTYFRWYQLIQFYSIFFIKRLESPVLLAFPVIITKYWVKKYFKDKLKWTINISLVLFVTVTWVTFLKVAIKTLKGQILWPWPLSGALCNLIMFQFDIDCHLMT